MKKKIIIINGKDKSGKDTFINHIASIKKTVNYSTISTIKNLAKQIGWNGTKTKKDRQFLSDLKKLIISYNDYPLKETLQVIEQFLTSNNEILFIHIREEEEIKKLINHCEEKIFTLYIKRDYHDCDMYLINEANYPYDYIIENDEINAFLIKAEEFIKTI